MFWKKQWRAFLLITAVFLASYYLPIEGLRVSTRWTGAFYEALHLLRWYAREHVLLCHHSIERLFCRQGLRQGDPVRDLGPPHRRNTIHRHRDLLLGQVYLSSLLIKSIIYLDLVAVMKIYSSIFRPPLFAVRVD